MSSIAFPRLQSKTALVTGASSGIGAATAQLFAKSGANVILLARREDKLSQVLAACQEANPKGIFHPVTMDVLDRKAVDGLVESLPDNLKDISFLVNNAGGATGTEKVGDIALKDLDTMLDLNVKSLVHMTQMILPIFQKKNSGHIINVGSVAGRESYANGSIYCAAKHAVKAFTGSLLKELYNTQIRVSEVQPGMVETEFSLVRMRGDADKANKVYENMEPLTGQDIAEEILWIASRPAHVNIAECFVMPVNQAGPGLVHRPGKQ